MTWQSKFGQPVGEDKAWFMLPDLHPGETSWNREKRLAKYCRFMQEQQKDKPSNYWDREAQSHEKRAEELSNLTGVV